MKLTRVHSTSQEHFKQRLDIVRAENEKRAAGTAGQPRLQRATHKEASGVKSVDDLVLAGNRSFENVDNIDFAAFRNDRETAAKERKRVEAQLDAFHSDRKSRAYQQDLSRIMHARYLQGHGVQVQSHLDRQELRQLRIHLQREASTFNVADTVRAFNESLDRGTEQVTTLLTDAERFLFRERGVDRQTFEQNFAALPLKDLVGVRNFSDAWSTSQGARFLTPLQGSNFAADRDQMARAMLAQHGYQGVESLDLNTVLSLLRDIDSEGPPTNSVIRERINQAVGQGHTDYFQLNLCANKAVLESIGVSPEFQKSLKVTNAELQEAYPDVKPAESRATRTRVLRDLLRVLPDEERQIAISGMEHSSANLITAESHLKKHLGQRIKQMAGPNIPYKEMGAMQRANFASALSKLPSDLRDYVFAGSERQAKNRLEKEIESRFGIEVHRRPETSPDDDPSVAPHVKDWPVQGLVDLFNALSAMSKEGELPQTMIGNTTLSYVEGHTDTPPMVVGPVPINDDPVGPWDRPGAYVHQSGKSEYFGMCRADLDGYDYVFLCDDAMMGINSDSAAGVSIGESTLIHELAHAIQLGGTPGREESVRKREDQVNLAQWSSLSEWREPNNLLADGRMGSFEYYYDPTVQVEHREQVATSYGASDPCEDFAEFSPFFFKAPEVAMQLSPEKFLYFNRMAEEHYEQNQIDSIAKRSGLTPGSLERARESMERKVRDAALGAGIKKSVPA